jgi:hypothetical protein
MGTAALSWSTEDGRRRPSSPSHCMTGEDARPPHNCPPTRFVVKIWVVRATYSVFMNATRSAFSSSVSAMLKRWS